MGMLILPIVNKRRVMNVRLRLKDARRIREGVSYDDTTESEIIVNREKSKDKYIEKKKWFRLKPLFFIIPIIFFRLPLDTIHTPTHAPYLPHLLACL